MLLGKVADFHACSMAECLRKGIEFLAKEIPSIEVARKAEARRMEEAREAEARREEEAREAIARERRWQSLRHKSRNPWE